MKKIVISISILAFALVAIAFLSASHEENPMIGTWTMKSGVYLGPDGRTSSAPTNSKQMKVINNTHFTTLWQNTDTYQNMGFNGGRYTYKNGVYSEYLDYFSITNRLGDTAYYKVDIKDNTLSISACDANGEVSETGYFQVWERIK